MIFYKKLMEMYDRYKIHQDLKLLEKECDELEKKVMKWDGFETPATIDDCKKRDEDDYV